MASDKMKAIYKVTDTHIYGFFDRHRYLSNFHLHPVDYEGIRYPSNENAYHAAKVLPGSTQVFFVNRHSFLLINPPQAKSLGRRVNLRNDWLFELPPRDQRNDDQGILILQIRDKIMYELNVIKFQDPELRKLLLETGDLYLEETNWWKDDYWGVWEGNGLNKLGRILMLIRSNIKKELL